MTEICTPVFRVSHGAFLRQSLGNVAFWPIFFAGLFLLLSGIFAIFVDVRFFVVALMLVLVGFPMLLFFVYFSDALRSVNSLNVLPHSVTITTEGLLVVVYPPDKKNQGKEEGADTPGKTEENDTPEPVRKFIPAARMCSLRSVADGAVLHIKPEGEKMQILLFPTKAFEDTETCKATLSALKSLCREDRPDAP